MSNLVEIEPEYVYMTIPKEYVCVYQRILAMMADYGVDMLKDCKASCTDKNSGVIECFNMFNAAVAARKLGNTSEADTIIKYVKAKINQIYKNADNSTDFIFPVDEHGELKAFVSCGETTKLHINPDDMELYQHKFGDGIDRHFVLGNEDEPSYSAIKNPNYTPATDGLDISIKVDYHKEEDTVKACPEVSVYYNGEQLSDVDYDLYYDNSIVETEEELLNHSTGVHNFKVVVNYKGQTKIKSIDSAYGININTTNTTNKKKRKLSNMPRYIHYRSIKNTSLEKEVYYTNTITIKGAKGQTFEVPGFKPQKDYVDFVTTIKEENQYTINTNNIVVFVSISKPSYITKWSKNKFRLVVSSELGSYQEFKLPKPTIKDIKNFIEGNKDNWENIRLEIRRRRSYRVTDKSRGYRCYKKWTKCPDFSFNSKLFKVRFFSNRGNRSDWVMVVKHAKDRFNNFYEYTIL